MLKRKFATAAGWAFRAAAIRFALSASAFVLIARLIGPQAFGLSALAAVPVVLLQTLVGEAAGEALVQRAGWRDERSDSLFWCVLALSALAAAAVALAAPLLAAALGNEALSPLLRVYSLMLPLVALQTVPEAQLARDLDFRALNRATSVSTALAAVTGVAAAAAGAGAWAPIVYAMVSHLVRAAMLWRAAPWRPQRRFSARDASDLWTYAAPTVGVRLMLELDHQIPRMAIGATLGVAAVGHYGLARRLFDMLSELLVRPLNSLTVPALAHARDRGEALGPWFARGVTLSAAIAYPAFLGLIAVAPLLVPLVFGSPWEAAVPVVQITALIGLRSAVGSFNGATLRACGKPSWQLALTTAGLVLSAVLVPLAASWGLAAAAAAMVVRSYLTWPLGAWMVARLGVLPMRAQLRLGRAPLLAGLAMAGAVVLLLQRMAAHGPLPAAWQLGVAVLFGALAYTGLILLLTPQVLSQAREIWRSRGAGGDTAA